jgi:hypothetical protein
LSLASVVVVVVVVVLDSLMEFRVTCDGDGFVVVVVYDGLIFVMVTADAATPPLN